MAAHEILAEAACEPRKSVGILLDRRGLDFHPLPRVNVVAEQAKGRAQQQTGEVTLVVPPARLTPGVAVLGSPPCERDGGGVHP